MTRRIDKDRARYNKLIRGSLKEKLKEYMKKGELIGKRSGRIIKVPIPRIDLPKIIYGNAGSSGGAGDGSGEESQKAGDKEGEYLYEEFTIEELARILSEELELPNIKPKGSKTIKTLSEKLKTITRTGPENRKHLKRTYKQALKRAMSSRDYHPFKPIVPARPDRRIRNYMEEASFAMNALIFYIMDVSGSMGEKQKELARIFNYWVDIWLADQYEGLESRYIVHTVDAKEVTKDDFYHTRESGGTMISSAFEKCVEILERDYNVDQWNVYILYCSDGDNWSTDDTSKTLKIIDDKLLPVINMLGYSQVLSQWGSGEFLKDLNAWSKANNYSLISTTNIKDNDGILPAIKDIFGKGQ
ncbi:MAG: DUF444 family protein [Nanoarchaeota archaeon]|nr:DUF444 family protein [Nanoarchaeota archaeon]